MRRLLSFLLLSTPFAVKADVTLPRIFSDFMVLQRRQPVPVWGWATPGEQVTVIFSGQAHTATTDAQGQWQVVLRPMEAGGPENMEIRGQGKPVTLKNVLIGEVWICSGQSNMEWPVSLSKNAETEIRNGNDSLIRHFKVPHTMAGMPQKDVSAGYWEFCSPATVGEFTAVGYFFAQQLRAELGVPVGLVNASWGGTISETWTSRAALAAHPAFSGALENVPTDVAVEMARINEQYAPMIASLKAQLPTPLELEQWPMPDYNDSLWEKMPVPRLWSGGVLESFDGTLWFRYEWTMPSDWSFDQPVTLSLGAIDDQDITYINGVQVGATNVYNKKRVYEVPPGTVRPGRNVIAVRVLDTGGGGGLYGAPEELYLAMGNTRFPLAGDWKYRIASILRVGGNLGPNDYPTLLYNAMLHPLIPYSMQGVIWYQGESNAGRAAQYREAFPLMIQDWRAQWKQGDFPFLFVQLANYYAEGGTTQNGGSTWAELREAQTMTLRLPKTGMAVTVDIGDSHDIHPTNKQDVGKRLAAQALQIAYNRKKTAQGPVFSDLKIKKEQAVLSFDNTKGGLKKGRAGATLEGFEIAGADQRFVPAKAVIRRKKVVISADTIPQPVAVRYAWADDPNTANLYNGAGFPAVPFRTDSWEGKTDKVKYGVVRK